MKKKSTMINVTTAHQRIDDHEKLCRILHKETNTKISLLKLQVHRLEKIMITSTGMLIVGMATIIHRLIVY